MTKKQIKIIASIVVLGITSLHSIFLKSTSKPNAPSHVSSQFASVPVVQVGTFSDDDLAGANLIGTYKVTKVIDGDTIQIEMPDIKRGGVDRDATQQDETLHKKTLRLIGINTPETVDPHRKVECFGKEASARSKELLTGQSVRIEHDPTQTERDKYGRLLVYVYLEDGRLFNKLMIEDGYAYEYTYNKPYKYQKEFKDAQLKAEKEGRGLWAKNTCAGVR